MKNYPQMIILSLIVVSSIFGAASGQQHDKTGQGYVILDDFSDVYDYLEQDNVRVKVRAGTYKIEKADSEPLISFTGNNSRYDLTDVKLVVEHRPCNSVIGLIGENIVLEGLHLETVKSTEKCRRGLGTLGINITGSNNTLLNVKVTIQDSYPYGYGSSFGIGRGASVRLSKGNGIRVGPADNTVIRGCSVIMRAFGHGIFIRGGDKTLIEDTSVEGALRQTNDMLLEKEGVAVEQGFVKASGEIIRPEKITSLSEDGIRIYPDSGTKRNYKGANDRKTGSVTLINSTVKRMRRGICLALGGSGHTVIDCTVTECTRVGYNIGSGTTLRDCRGDAKYCQVLDIPRSHSTNCNVRLKVLDSRQRQGNIFGNDPGLLAKINGSDHQIYIEPASPDAVPSSMTIEIGGPVGWLPEDPSQLKGKSIRLINKTPSWVLLHPAAENCMVKSSGPVVNYGKPDNKAVLDRQSR